MEKMLDIPPTKRRLSVVQLCVIMGCTALLFIMVATRFGTMAQAMIQNPVIH